MSNVSQPGLNHCFSSGFIAYESSASDSEMVPLLTIFKKLFLIRDLAISENYSTSAMPRIKFLMTG